MPRTRSVVWAFASFLVTSYSAARVGVLLFEAYSVVSTERAEDVELAGICADGYARGSTKMRNACLRAKADLASPILFKIAVHAANVLIRDFADAIGSPFKMTLLITSAIVTSLSLSHWWLQHTAASRYMSDARRHGEDATYVTFVSPTETMQPAPLRRRLGSAMAIRWHGVPEGTLCDEERGGADAAPDWTEVDLSNAAHAKVD